MGDSPSAEIRTVGVQVLASMGWLSGTLHLSGEQGVLQHLNAGGRLLSLTGVALPERGQEVDFLALRKAHISLVVPNEGSPLGLPVDGGVEHHVRCLLERGRITGLLQGPSDTRLSDFLCGHEGFFVLRDAALRGPTAEEESSARSMSVVIVNDQALIAVTEWLEEGWSPGGHPPK